MRAATRVKVGLLLCLVVLQPACTTLPLQRPTAPESGSGDPATRFPGLRCCDVSELRFYFTGDAFLERAEELIRTARDYILIDSFIIVDDEKGKHVLGLLRRRIDEGLRVYVMTDSCSGFVSGFVDGRTAVPHMVELGIPVVEFNPMRPNRSARLPKFLYRDHRKFWLIDGETVVLGGQNIWSASLDSPAEGGTTDSMVEFRSGTAARELADSFVRQWNAYSMEKLKGADFAATPGGTSGACLWLLNQERLARPLVGRMFDGLLSAAEREIWLIQSYTMPDRSLLRRIRQATDEGVRVNILFSSAYASMDKFYYSTSYRMRDLIRAGAVVWEYGHPLSHLHYKGVIVDDRWFAIGSANLNYRSCHLSKELNVVFEGSDLGAAMLDNLEELVAASRRVGESEAARRRGFRYLLYYLIMFYGG